MMEGSIILHLSNYKLVFLILALLLLTGCNERVTDYVSHLMSNASDYVSEVTDAASEYIEENPPITPHEYAVNTFNEVFELVQEKDTQAIYDMFSEYDKKNIDLMSEIDKLVEFIKGEVIEIRHVGASNLYSSVRDGVTVRAAYTATSFVKTDSEVTYWVKVRVITADDDETKLGFDSIYILNCDVKTSYVDECIEWNERRKNSSKENEPQQPEDMEIGVNY